MRPWLKMLRRFALALSLAAGAAALAGPASAQRGIEDRDWHYRLGRPQNYNHYKYYPAPRTYYPTRPEYADKPLRVPRPKNPSVYRKYGTPPRSIDELPRF